MWVLAGGFSISWCALVAGRFGCLSVCQKNVETQRRTHQKIKKPPVEQRGEFRLEVDFFISAVLFGGICHKERQREISLESRSHLDQGNGKSHSGFRFWGVAIQVKSSLLPLTEQRET